MTNGQQGAMSEGEREAIERAAHIALDSTRARQVRAFLVDKFGAGMVTDDMVRVTVAAMIENDRQGGQS